ncbi:MAG: PspC domain-containing protein [Lachnospiraceae bacterium]|nr:PspC domain-containing protein [Lachnospiraceae bacterium]
MKRLTKSNVDKKLAGVCGGIAEYFGIDSTIIRIGLILFCCMGGSGFLAYVLAAIVMPEDPYGDYE